MPSVIFDIETDSLESSTRIWCIVTRDADTGTILTSTSLASGHEASLKVLREAACIIGQNIIGFDLPILQQLLAFIPTKKILDTLTLSRLIYPDLRNDDWKRVGFNKELIGSHSLKAWGQRLGLLKDTYGENADWSAWTQEMQDYCEVDTKVTLALYQHLLAQGPAPKAVELELGVARICQRIERAGWHFDRPGADRLTAQLLIKRVDLKEQLVKVFPAKMIQMKTKVKTAVFNPGSRMDIARGLNELYGWQAEEVTPSGQPKIDEAVLSKLPYPEAKLLCEYLLIVKRLGQIGEGEEAWVKLSRNGVIHGRINTNGAVTGRATHSKPNMAQVPASRSPYGKECRSLFGPRPNWVLVGADASGLELRCLSHFLHAYDDGLYCKAVLEGDIHWTNAIAFGVVPAGTKRDKHNADLEEKRNIAKTLIYAMIYGAGDLKLGMTVGGGVKEGKRLRSSFEKKVGAYKVLKDCVSAASKRGYLIGLDGRHLPIRSEHAALNTLLQSAGAVIMKQALLHFVQNMSWANLEWGKDYAVIGWIHDEFQIECRRGLEDHIGINAVGSIKSAGETLGFRCALDGEFRTGATWAETH